MDGYTDLLDGFTASFSGRAEKEKEVRVDPEASNALFKGLFSKVEDDWVAMGGKGMNDELTPAKTGPSPSPIGVREHPRAAPAEPVPPPACHTESFADFGQFVGARGADSASCAGTDATVPSVSEPCAASSVSSNSPRMTHPFPEASAKRTALSGLAGAAPSAGVPAPRTFRQSDTPEETRLTLEGMIGAALLDDGAAEQPRAMPEAAPVPVEQQYVGPPPETAKPAASNLETLMDMGFGKDSCLAALAASAGNLHRAVEVLSEQAPREPASGSTGSPPTDELSPAKDVESSPTMSTALMANGTAEPKKRWFNRSGSIKDDKKKAKEEKKEKVEMPAESTPEAAAASEAQAALPGAAARRYRVTAAGMVLRKTAKLSDTMNKNYPLAKGDVVTGVPVTLPEKKKDKKKKDAEGEGKVWIHLQNGAWLPCETEDGARAVEEVGTVAEETAVLAAGSELVALAASDDQELFFALRHGRVALADTLLAAGSACNVTEAATGRTALELIEQHPAFDDHPRTESVLQRLARCVPLTATDGQGRTPLHRAVAAGKVDLSLSLLNAGAFLDVADAQGHHPLHLALDAKITNAARFASWQTVLQELATRAALGAPDSDGNPPLHAALRAGKGPGQVAMLLDFGARPDQKDSRGRVPLLPALATPAFYSHPRAAPVLERLCAAVKGAALDQPDAETGLTALHAAVKTGQAGLVNMVLAAGASPFVGIGEDGACGPSGPLHEAARVMGKEAEWKGIVDALCGTKPRLIDALNAKDEHGNTPMHVAVAAGNLAAVGWLHAQRPVVSEVNNVGDTPLHVACRTAVFNLLGTSLTPIAPDSLDLNVPNAAGNTPLHCAIAAGHFQMAHELLALGARASADCRNAAGQYPHTLLVEILAKSGATDPAALQLKKRLATPAVVMAA